MTQLLSQKQKGALFGLFVGDAVAMPVHWMYDLSQLKKDYGQITTYTKPLDHFQGSIMNLSNTGGAGRGSDKGEIVGKVILHGKKQYWGRGANYHYHCGLQAGENTLEAQLTRLCIRHIINKGTFEKGLFQQEYSTFMQTPGSHNDTYAASAHRMFFSNLVQGKTLEQCPDNDNHNVDAIDALTISVPVILKYQNSPREERNKKVMEAITSIRRVQVVEKYALIYSDLLVEVLNGKDVKIALQTAADKLNYGSLQKLVQNSKSDPMVACYIEDSFGALLFLTYKYSENIEKAILANANAGGENVARGGLLATLLGAAYGFNAFPNWSYELYQKQVILAEIDSFLEKLK